VSCSNAVAIFTAVVVAVNFIMSGLVTDGTAICLRFLFGESSETWSGGEGSFNGVVRVFVEVEDGSLSAREYDSGNTFYGDRGFYDGGWRSVHGGEPRRWGLGKGGSGFLSGLCGTSHVGEQDMVKRGVSLSFD